jgi:hypothetical protein
MNHKIIIPYRSPGLHPGDLRRLGGIHLHVDGGGDHAFVRHILGELEKFGAKGKTTAISLSVEGPQRRDEPLTYASHTPGTANGEQFDYFLTSSLENRADALRTLGIVLPQIADRGDIVVEVEQVIATFERSAGRSDWRRFAGTSPTPIRSYEVGFNKGETLAFEIHHAIDFPSRGVPSFSVQKLLEETVPMGLRVGGWFSFVKPEGIWSFRSNAFTEGKNLEAEVRAQSDLLCDYLSSNSDTFEAFRLWTIVECVLGIWHTPLSRVAKEADETAI